MSIQRIIELRPSFGWVAAVLPTSAGLLNLLTHIQVTLGIISLCIGIAVGFVTLLIQIRVYRSGKK